MKNRFRNWQFKEKIGLIYIISMCYILPLVVHNGYYDLGTTKMQMLIYINIGFWGSDILLHLVDALRSFFHRKKWKAEKQYSHDKNRLSRHNSLDLIMILLIMVLVVSFSLSRYKDYIFWGAPGWGMGFVPCLLFVWSYFFVSNISVKKDTLVRIFSYSVFIPAFIGFCNGLHMDILGMNKGLSPKNRFFMISTIGNTTWYSAYICIFLPFVLYLCFKTENKWEKLITISNFILCVGSVLLAKTDSGYFTLFFVLVFSLCVLDTTRKKWWLYLLYGGITIMILFIILLVLNTSGLLPEILSEQLPDSYFFFNDAWGNSRGFLWKNTIKVYIEQPMKNKVVGVGPDGFGMAFLTFLRNYPKIYTKYAEMYGQQMVVNAHNEYLNQLISLGVIGLSIYLIIGGSVLWQTRDRYKMKECNDQFYTICTIGVIAYFLHTFVSYAQPCATPYLYILLGVWRGRGAVSNK